MFWLFLKAARRYGKKFWIVYSLDLVKRFPTSIDREDWLRYSRGPATQSLKSQLSQIASAVATVTACRSHAEPLVEIHEECCAVQTEG